MCYFIIISKRNEFLAYQQNHPKHSHPGMLPAIAFASVLASTAAQGGVFTRLFACDATSPTQQWQRGPTDNEIVQKSGGACLDVDVRRGHPTCVYKRGNF